MSRSYDMYVDDVIQSCNNVIEFTSGLTREEFFNDKKTRGATIRNVEIIGEAAKKIPMTPSTFGLHPYKLQARLHQPGCSQSHKVAFLFDIPSRHQQHARAPPAKGGAPALIWAHSIVLQHRTLTQAHLLERSVP